MQKISDGCHCGVMVIVLDGCLEVSEFKFHLYYYVHFQTNNLWKGTELNYHIYQPLRSGRIWHKVNF